MAAINKYRVGKEAKRSKNKIAKQPLRYRTKPKKSDPVPAGRVIIPKSSPSVLDAKVLETFSLADFIEMAAAGRPYPVDPIIDDRPLDLPHTITAGDIWDAGAQTKADIANRDAAVERVLEDSRFSVLRDSVLCAQLPDHMVERTLARSNFASFLSNTFELFASLVDRKPFDINFTTSTFLPVGEAGGRFVFAQSAMQANPVPALFQRLVSLLGDADAARLRRCAFEGCKRVFYAKRKDSMCCTARCNNCRLQREWYQRRDKSAKYIQGKERGR